MKGTGYVYMPLVLGAVMLMSSCGGNGEGAEKAGTTHNVFVTVPEAQGVSLEKDYAAVVQEQRTIEAGFKTGGTIERVYAKEGDYVRQGQTLAELDAADYALGVRQLQVQYDQTLAKIKRLEKLHVAKNVSDNEYEEATSGLAQLKAQLDLQRNKLDYTKLVAPASGYIVKRNHERGESVQAGSAIFELMDDSALEVIVDIPVSEFLNRENFASFMGRTSVKGHETIPLQMLSLTPKADNNQLYQLRLSVPAGERSHLTSGMNLTVTIQQKEGSKNPSVSVPASAVFALESAQAQGKESNGKPTEAVWVVNLGDSTITARPVRTDASIDGGDRIVITSGLEGTETVVRAGATTLQEGEKVTILPESSGTNPGNLL